MDKGASRPGDTPPVVCTPVLLDEHRGMKAQQATEIRRRLGVVEQEQAALRLRQSELEKYLLAAPSTSWEDAAEKARYLIGLLAGTTAGRDPRRQKIIAGVLADFRRLAGGPDVANDPP